MKFLFTFCFLSLCFIAESQCCPYINSIEIIPASPTTADNIKVVTTVTTPNQGTFINSTHTVNGNTIDIEACYYSGLLTSLQTFYDTLNIGLLSAGIYTVNLTAYESFDTICNYTDTSTSVMNFTVIDQISEISSINNNIGQLYPNPTSGSFIIELPDEVIATNLCIQSITGEVVHQGVFTNELSVNLESGIYLVQLFHNQTILGYHRILIF